MFQIFCTELKKQFAFNVKAQILIAASIYVFRTSENSYSALYLIVVATLLISSEAALLTQKRWLETISQNRDTLFFNDMNQRFNASLPSSSSSPSAAVV